MVENVYDLARDGKYDVKVDLIPRKKATSKVVLKSLLQEIQPTISNGVQKLIVFKKHRSRQNYCLLRCFYFSNSIPKTVKCPLPTNLITNWAKWLGVISVSLVIHQ